MLPIHDVIARLSLHSLVTPLQVCSWCRLRKKLRIISRVIISVFWYSLPAWYARPEWACLSQDFLTRQRAYWNHKLYSFNTLLIPCFSATQEDDMGQLYLSNVDFLKNGVPASIIAALVSLSLCKSIALAVLTYVTSCTKVVATVGFGLMLAIEYVFTLFFPRHVSQNPNDLI